MKCETCLRPPATSRSSMKGAVKKNISPQTGHRDERLVVAASPLLRLDELLIRLWRFRLFITIVVVVFRN